MTEQNSTMKTEYKDSGIPWIGRIPGHWKVIKYKHIACIKSGDPISVYDLSENACYPVFGGGKLIGYVNKYNVSDVILIGRVGSCGSITNIREKSWATDNALVLETKKNKNYIYYILLASDLKSLIGTNAQPLITAGKILNYCIPYTFQKEEQHAIAAYLDRKCSAIDRVIEAESRIIEKLKEYRQSLITEAVSHGLNSHAPMKASGIPWIGRIPRHWELRKLKNILKLRNEKKEYSGESYIGLENIESHSGKYIPPKEIIVDGISNRFFCGDVIFGKLRPYLAKAAITDFDGLCSSEFLVMKEFKGDRRYLLGILLSYWFIDIVNSSTYGTKMPRASWEFIGNMYVPYPPLSEQISIADFLDKKCSAIDSTISKKQHIIEKMTEYKKSLIYECVTGKISI